MVWQNRQGATVNLATSPFFISEINKWTVTCSFELISQIYKSLFFSHNKSAKGIFCHGLSAKRSLQSKSVPADMDGREQEQDPVWFRYLNFTICHIKYLDTCMKY